MKDPRDDTEPEKFFCKCSKCKGDSFGFDFNDMLDPHGDCISRWCANLATLYRFENEGPMVARTSAEWELRHIGAEAFYTKYYDFPLTPILKENELMDNSSEITRL